MIKRTRGRRDEGTTWPVNARAPHQGLFRAAVNRFPDNNDNNNNNDNNDQNRKKKRKKH